MVKVEGQSSAVLLFSGEDSGSVAGLDRGVWDGVGGAGLGVEVSRTRASGPVDDAEDAGRGWRLSRRSVSVPSA